MQPSHEGPSGPVESTSRRSDSEAADAEFRITDPKILIWDEAFRKLAEAIESQAKSVTAPPVFALLHQFEAMIREAREIALKRSAN